MSIEKAIELAAKLQAAREEVTRLENEFVALIAPPVRRQTQLPLVEANEHDAGNGRRPVRTKIKILRVFQKTEGAIRLLEVRKKLNLSESCVFNNVQSLLKEKQLVRTGHGLYTKA